MTLERLPSGIPGLDDVTHGGFVQGAIYLVMGRPGAGKSIFGNQIAYAHAKRGGRAVYATLLSETHARLLSQIRQLSFFDEAAVGKDIVYLNALAALESGGLDALLKSVQAMVREQKAELLVVDGLLPPSQLGVDDLAYKKFVAALQSWVGVIGCTVIILKTGSVETIPSAEQTMVDGIVELTMEQSRMRLFRRLAVTKLRGTGFIEGKHAYCISDRGMELYPRIEAIIPPEGGVQPMDERVSTGVEGLDAMFGGALVRGSMTLVLGSSGAGKSTTGLQFVLEGARKGEPSLFYGLFEPLHVLRRRAERLGHPIAEYEAKGLLTFAWHDSSQTILDREAHDLRARVRETKARRLTLDGFAGFRNSDEYERLSSAFAAVSNELARHGVTTLITDETRELFIREVQVPTSNVSALFHNIIFLRQVEREAALVQLLGVLKARDSNHDRRLWQLEIGDKGLRLVHPFGPDEHRLMRGGGAPDA